MESFEIPRHALAITLSIIFEFLFKKKELSESGDTEYMRRYYHTPSLNLRLSAANNTDRHLYALPIGHRRTGVWCISEV